jgi:hypothetical protein
MLLLICDEIKKSCSDKTAGQLTVSAASYEPVLSIDYVRVRFSISYTKYLFMHECSSVHEHLGNVGNELALLKCMCRI